MPTSQNIPPINTGINVVVNGRNCIGSQLISVTTGATSSLTVPNGAYSAIIQPDGASISITQDGTAPTATTGLRIDDGVLYPVDSLLSSVSMIARTITTNVQVLYFDRI